MKNAPLQQFTKKESPWRFLKLALKLRAPEPAFRHVLVTLADHANRDDHRRSQALEERRGPEMEERLGQLPSASRTSTNSTRQRWNP
jgi:hypothetical protein